MSLRERLEAAKAERRVRAGLPAEAPDTPARDHEATLDLTSYAPVVDLRTGLERREPRFVQPFEIGVGDKCPSCASSSRLDMEDVGGGVDHYSCTGCGLLYQVAR